MLDEISCSALLITEAYCLQLQDSAQDCNISLLSVDYHSILLQHLCIFVQNGRWVGLKLKIGHFEHEVPLGSILFPLIEDPASAQDWFGHRDKTSSCCYTMCWSVEFFSVEKYKNIIQCGSFKFRSFSCSLPCLGWVESGISIEIRLGCRWLQKWFLIWNYYVGCLWAPLLVLTQSKETVFDQIWCFFTIKARFWQYYS